MIHEVGRQGKGGISLIYAAIPNEVYACPRKTNRETGSVLSYCQA